MGHTFSAVTRMAKRLGTRVPKDLPTTLPRHSMGRSGEPAGIPRQRRFPCGVLMIWQREETPRLKLGDARTQLASAEPAEG